MPSTTTKELQIIRDIFLTGELSALIEYILHLSSFQRQTRIPCKILRDQKKYCPTYLYKMAYIVNQSVHTLKILLRLVLSVTLLM